MSEQLRTPTIEAYWPTTQSLDLVRGELEATAMAVAAEVARFVKGESLEASWLPFPSLHEAIGTPRVFTNVPTLYAVVPTKSPWTVLWNNSFLCDGYDSLCWCLTKHHGLETLHWSSHDQTTTFQAGTSFTHRTRDRADVLERAVYVGREDRRWLFHESGTPLSEEDVDGYKARLKRKRLNEHRMVELLGRLQARPWDESFYDTGSGSRYFRMRRLEYPATITERDRQSVLTRGAT